ncbi:MAG: four helix bundle protein [Candidatus Brocadiales bacterium]|nr:four helix bundle protein [Candidatus Brocadiales bacterium]
MEKKIKSFKDLEIWKRSIGLVKEIYQISETFPKAELYGLTNQLRRAAISIPSNIAEGHTRRHTKEFRQFLYVALGSLAEVETLLTLAVELKCVHQDKILPPQREIEELGKMINALLAKLKSRTQDYTDP